MSCSSDQQERLTVHHFDVLVGDMQIGVVVAVVRDGQRAAIHACDALLHADTRPLTRQCRRRTMSLVLPAPTLQAGTDEPTNRAFVCTLTGELCVVHVHRAIQRLLRVIAAAVDRRATC
jgi:hypothetical protein